MAVEDTEVEVATEGEGAGGDLSSSTFRASEEYGEPFFHGRYTMYL